MEEAITDREIIRQCVSCKQKSNRNFLIRLLRDFKSGECFINPSKKQFGRSFYLCKNETCILNLDKNKKYKNKISIEKIKEELKK